MSGLSTLAIDFGGTYSRAALVSPDGQIIRRERTLSCVTDAQEVVLNRLITLGREVVADEPIAAIGVAAPGPLDARRGMIHHANTLPGWQNVPLAHIISEAFGGVPTRIENDGNLAALAEFQAGAGRGADPLIYITLSTGIGGGAILNGKLFTGWSGLAIEPGHIRLPHTDGHIYRLEDLASGTAIGVWARKRLAADDRPSLLRALNDTAVDGKAVGSAAVQGDPLALDVIQVAGEALGLGLVALLHLFSPEAIVFGGSVSQLGDLLFDPARRVLAENLLDPLFIPPDLIRMAALGDNACLIGAACYARDLTD